MSRRKPRTTLDAVLRQRVVGLALEVGPAEASRQTGVKEGTVKSWLAREKKGSSPVQNAAPSRSVPPLVQTDPELERMRRTRDAARGTVERGVHRVDELLAESKSPQSVAIACGILADKSMQLDSLIRASEVERVDLDVARQKLAAAVVELALNAVGVELGPTGSAVRGLLQAVAEQAARGEALSPPEPLASEAAREIRERFDAQDRLALPAPEDADVETVNGEVVE